MIRIEAIERALPRDWRAIIRDHPFLSLAVAAAAGVYLGRNHSRELLGAVTTAGVGLGSAKLKDLTASR